MGVREQGHADGARGMRRGERGGPYTSAFKPRLSQTSGLLVTINICDEAGGAQFHTNWRPAGTPSAEAMNQDAASVESLTLDHVAFQP